MSIKDAVRLYSCIARPKNVTCCRYSPVGVLFLVMEEVVSMSDPKQTFEQLSFYFLTVMVGLAIHCFFTLPLVFILIVRRNPYRFMYGMLQAIVTALGTSSRSV